jgi:hypothetical protein
VVNKNPDMTPSCMLVFMYWQGKYVNNKNK